MNSIENEEAAVINDITEDNEENYRLEGVELTSEGNKENEEGKVDEEKEEEEEDDNDEEERKRNDISLDKGEHEDNLKQKQSLNDNDNNRGNLNEIPQGETFCNTNNLNQVLVQSNICFYPKNSYLIATISSTESFSITSKQTIKEVFNSQSSSENKDNRSSSFPSIDKLPEATLSTLYTQLLSDYRRVSKEKAKALASLNDEILTNEKQRVFIALQKSMMNEMVASSSPRLKQPKTIQSSTKPKDEAYSKQSRDQFKAKEDYANLLMEIPIIRDQLKDSEAKVKQLTSFIEQMAQRESDLIASIEQEAQAKLAVLENNKSLYAQIDQMTSTIEQYQSQAKSNEQELNSYKAQLAQYDTMSIEKEKLMKDFNKEQASNQLSTDTITQLTNDIQAKTNLIKETEKEIVILTLSNKNNKINIDKVTKDNAVLTKENQMLKEKEAELNKAMLSLNDELKSLTKKMATNLKETSITKDQKDLMMNEQLASYQKLKSQYDLLQNDSNSQLILISGLKETVGALTKQTKEDQETIAMLSKQLNSNEVVIAESKLKLDQITKDYEKLQSEYKENITQLQSSYSELAQKEKENIAKHLEDLNQRNKEIFILKSKLDNPKQYPNMQYYNPKLAIQSCLIAANHLIDQSHSFYSEKDYQIFFESVNDLRRELGICFDALSNNDELRSLTIKNQQCLQQLNSYRNDNKKLYDHCNDLKSEISTQKEYNALYQGFIKLIMGKHISDKTIKDNLNELMRIDVDLIEMMREHDTLEHRNELLFKQNEEVFRLCNEGRYKELNYKEQKMICDYNDINELKEKLKLDIGKRIQRKEDLNNKLNEIEKGIHN